MEEKTYEAFFSLGWGIPVFGKHRPDDLRLLKE